MENVLSPVDPLQTNPSVSDEELVVRARESANAFRVLVDRYWKRLYAFVRRLYQLSHEDIQDILQEAFIKAYRNLHAFDPDLTFSTWMYQITRHTAIDALRKKRAQPLTASIDDEEVPIELAGPDAVRMHYSADEFERLTVLIRQLPVKYREALVLRYLEEKTYEEMIDILKKPKGTIASLVNRGRAMVRAKAKEAGVELYDAI